jgi:hypothetical protein
VVARVEQDVLEIHQSALRNVGSCAIRRIARECLSAVRPGKVKRVPTFALTPRRAARLSIARSTVP